MKRHLRHSLLASLLAALASVTHAAPVALQEPTATFSQYFNGPNLVDHAIDGVFSGNNGWAILGDHPGTTESQTAVFETATDIANPGGSLLTFDLYQQWSLSGFSQHLLGRFRLSVTGDDRSTFADGLDRGGDVTATWTVLTPSSFSATNGVVLTLQGDSSLLSSGALPGTSIYSVTASTSLSLITGIRLEVLADPSLPDNGPGRFSNGNITLSEITLDAAPIPEPGSAALLAGAGALSAALLPRRRRTR